MPERPRTSRYLSAVCPIHVCERIKEKKKGMESAAQPVHPCSLTQPVPFYRTRLHFGCSNRPPRRPTPPRHPHSRHMPSLRLRPSPHPRPPSSHSHSHRPSSRRHTHPGKRPPRQHPEKSLRGAHEVQDLRAWWFLAGLFEQSGDFVEGSADGGEVLSGWEVGRGEHGLEGGDDAAETVAGEVGWCVA